MSALEFRDVVKHYPSGSDVIRAADGVSLTVAPGEIVALYGPSGSGKTTLLLLAAGLITPDRGDVLFGGRSISGLSRNESARHRRSLGFVFQSPHLQPNASAIDNASVKLLVGRVSPKQARSETAPWLARLGIAARADHTPGKLSNGERQRVAIARALANDPKLILADEPTGSLDTETSRQILGIMARICRERSAAMLMVTHDPEAADFADRVCDLRDGALSERRGHTPLALASPRSPADTAPA